MLGLLLFTLGAVGCARPPSPPLSSPPAPLAHEEEEKIPPFSKASAPPSSLPPTAEPACESDPNATVAKPFTAAEARVMARAVPLDADTIDFMRIGNFFDLYRHVLDTHGDPRKCEVKAIMAKTDKAMKGLSELTASGQRTFNLHSDARTVASWLQQPVTRRYMPFCEGLQFVVQSTQSVLTIFINTYVKEKAPAASPFRSEDADSLRHQVLDGGSVAIQNLELIAAWKDNVNDVIKLQ